MNKHNEFERLKGQYSLKYSDRIYVDFILWFQLIGGG